MVKNYYRYLFNLIIISITLIFSSLSFAKDRIQYNVQNFDGSTLKVINEQGVVSQSYQYTPFGQQLQYKKPSNLKNPNAFVGGIQDTNDLIYLQQRYYNPVLGRFYQPDPVTFIINGHGQTNRYQYGWNDSYSFKDPSGQAAQLAFVPLVLWIADNLRSDTPNANNLPPSGIGDAAIAGYGGASLLFSARLASMSTAELSYYNIVQNSASISPVVWLTPSALQGASPILWDGAYATRQILGTTTTPAGRSINFHAAERMVYPPKGRIPMSPKEIDAVLDGATNIRKMTYNIYGDTLTIQNKNMLGSPQVVVDAQTGNRIITVINPRAK
ncbi:RHS repeat-associated core domain-containing protein [Acinetobacter nematophilus]|uniref:RHS repeat-associated core domain-containing protein n=1 Tax=Acinetobacter nematophilus TaxID=2994642 RepID=UPI003AF641FB